MELRLERIAGNGEATLGLLFRDGRFECFTLEDEARARKVPGETRIPAGRYRIGLRREGGLSGRYAKRFAAMHRGMLWLRGVPGFEWIYIHVGNTDADTAGCILVGAGADAAAMTLRDSRAAYERLYRDVADAAAADELRITITDRDGGG